MLKGNNRSTFISKSIKQVRKALEEFELGRYHLDQGVSFFWR